MTSSTNTPDTSTTPEPLLNAEAVRVALLALGAGSWGVGLPIIVPVATTVVALVGSFALTMWGRGRVIAKRYGVDLDQLTDDVQARSRLQ